WPHGFTSKESSTPVRAAFTVRNLLRILFLRISLPRPKTFTEPASGMSKFWARHTNESLELSLLPCVWSWSSEQEGLRPHLRGEIRFSNASVRRDRMRCSSRDDLMKLSCVFTSRSLPILYRTSHMFL